MLARVLHTGATLRVAAPSARRAIAHLAPSGEWLEVDTSAPLEPDTVTLRLGICGEALDTIGDVCSIRWAAPAGGALDANAAVAELHWEGFERSASDELYHATWRNAKGVRRVAVPLPARLLSLNSSLTAGGLDEQAWLARLLVRRTAWEAWCAAQRLQQAASGST